MCVICISIGTTIGKLENHIHRIQKTDDRYKTCIGVEDDGTGWSLMTVLTEQNRRLNRRPRRF